MQTYKAINEVYFRWNNFYKRFNTWLPHQSYYMGDSHGCIKKKVRMKWDSKLHIKALKSRICPCSCIVPSITLPPEGFPMGSNLDGVKTYHCLSYFVLHSLFILLSEL